MFFCGRQDGAGWKEDLLLAMRSKLCKDMGGESIIVDDEVQDGNGCVDLEAELEALWDEDAEQEEMKM